MRSLLLTGMQLICSLILSVLLASLSVGTVSAQNTPTSRKARGWLPQQTDSTVCSDPPNPQAVSAEVNLCVDALVMADVQDTPGVRLDVTVLPENDLELLPMPDQQQFASRVQPAQTTSWSPQAMRTQELATAPTLSESASLSAVHLPAVTTLAPPEIDDTASLNLASTATLDRKLARARFRTQEEAKLRQSRQAQRDLTERCRQMHLSTLECRLKLTSQKLSATNRTSQAANSYQQASH